MLTDSLTQISLAFGQYLLDFGSKLYMLVSKCVLILRFVFSCKEKYFMLYLSNNNHPDAIEVSNSTSRYLDSLNIDNPYCELIIVIKLL